MTKRAARHLSGLALVAAVSACTGGNAAGNGTDGDGTVGTIEDGSVQPNPDAGARPDASLPVDSSSSVDADGSNEDAVVSPVDAGRADADAGDATPGSDDTPPVLSDFTVSANPQNVLSFVTLFDTDEPTTARLVVTDDVSGQAFVIHHDETSARVHEFDVIMLRAGRNYTVEAIATDAAGNSSSATTTFTTAALPEDIPRLQVQSDPSRTSPGLTLFGISTYSLGADGFLVAVDARGDVRWYHEGPSGPFHRMPNGNVAFIDDLSTATEIDVMGDIVRQWKAEDVRGAFFHHAIVPFGDDEILTLANESRVVDGYPDGGSLTVAGDAVRQMTRDGTVTEYWSLFDVLDPHRTPPGFFKTTPLGHDWTHANSVFHHAADDTLVVSSRTQSWVVKMTRDDPPQKVWLLGEGGDFTLTQGEWFYNQHAAEVLPNGHIIIYDNGNERPGGPFSRAVEYEVDTSTWTARQVWEFRDAEPFYSRIVCDADPLENGNVLIADVGRMSNPELDTWDSTNQKWMRIVEVTHTASPEIVFQLVIKEELSNGFAGHLGYEAERIPTLYPPSERVDVLP